MINVVELKKYLEAVNEEVHVDIKEHSAITMFKDRNGVEIEEQLRGDIEVYFMGVPVLGIKTLQPNEDEEKSKKALDVEPGFYNQSAGEILIELLSIANRYVDD